MLQTLKNTVKRGYIEQQNSLNIMRLKCAMEERKVRYKTKKKMVKQ